RSGGARLDFPVATLETFRRLPERPLEALLDDAAAPPEDVFLAAVTEARERRADVLERLVDRLPALGEARRDPVFAALQYLTGETMGRSPAQWRRWLDATRPGAAR